MINSQKKTQNVPVPNELSAEHRMMLTEESGIDPKIINARRYKTVTTKADLKSRGFADSQLRVPTLLIPIYSVHGELALYQAQAVN